MLQIHRHRGGLQQGYEGRGFVIVAQADENRSIRSHLTRLLMTLALILPTSNQTVIVPPGAVKDQLHRLSRFARWLDATGCSWYQPDLAAYRDFLLEEGLARTSVQAHLSTIR